MALRFSAIPLMQPQPLQAIEMLLQGSGSSGKSFQDLDRPVQTELLLEAGPNVSRQPPASPAG